MGREARWGATEMHGVLRCMPRPAALLPSTRHRQVKAGLGENEPQHGSPAQRSAARTSCISLTFTHASSAPCFRISCSRKKKVRLCATCCRTCTRSSGGRCGGAGRGSQGGLAWCVAGQVAV